jgi:addiction module HigA family antidote
MTKKLPKRGLPPMHPGELLREEILPALNRPKTEIAKLLGVSRQTLYDILEEKQPATPMMALRLGKLCGNGPDLWLNLQKRFDLQSGPSRSLERRSMLFPRWKWHEGLRQALRRGYVYRKLKSDYNGDEVRQGWRVNR